MIVPSSRIFTDEVDKHIQVTAGRIKSGLNEIDMCNISEIDNIDSKEIIDTDADSGFNCTSKSKSLSIYYYCNVNCIIWGIASMNSTKLKILISRFSVQLYDTNLPLDMVNLYSDYYGNE